MHFDTTLLTRYSDAPAPSLTEQAAHATQSDLLLFGAGNSGESVIQRVDALAWGDGQRLATFGLNNDALAPHAMQVCDAHGTLASIELMERLILGGDNPREQLHDYPLLHRRYATLLRGVPVLETYPRAGYGGHGHPVISALDIDLQIAELQAYVRRALRRLDDTFDTSNTGGWHGIAQSARQSAAKRKRHVRIAVIGGGGGSMGNAAHHHLPYLVRQELHERGFREYELWGFVLGPQAFTGLTPFIRANYRTLIQSLAHLTQHGYQHAYHTGLTIASKAPPYDRLFVLDDPRLPSDGNRVVEADLTHFFDQAALSIYLLLTRGTIWQTIASHMVNDIGLRDDGRLRFLNTVRSTMANVDRAHLGELLGTQIESRVLTALASRLTPG